MNTTKNSTDMRGYHWTLLVLQKAVIKEAKNGWRHYDSMAGTTTFKNRIAKECQTIVSSLKIFHFHICL
jgi:hypothetical protein